MSGHTCMIHPHLVCDACRVDKAARDSDVHAVRYRLERAVLDAALLPWADDLISEMKLTEAVAALREFRRWAKGG